MRARTGIDRLSGMDVRAAVRRTRLPFVTSLLLVALLGAPATVEPAPVAGPGAVAVSMGTAASVVAASVAPASEATAPAAPAAEPAGTPAVAAVHADVPPAGPGLTDQAEHAALAPRAPPTV